MTLDRQPPSGVSLLPDPTIAAQVLADSLARTAHHEAGHAVAVALRGGTIEDVWVNNTDWTALPLDAEIGKGGTTTYSNTTFDLQPFIAFAGPWSEAKWTVENESDLDPGSASDMDEAMQCAWDHNADGDTAKYEHSVQQLGNVAAQLGFSSVGRAWEWDWSDELEELWPAICEVAAMLINGTTVTDDLVKAAIDRCAASEVPQ